MAAVMTNSGWGVSLPGLRLTPGQRPYSSMTNLTGTPTSDSSVLLEPRFRRYPIGVPLSSRPRNNILISSARDSNSLPSFNKKGVGKRRSSSCRDESSKLSKSPTPDQEYPSKKNSALFSPYSPLPAIGEPTTAREMNSDGEPSMPQTSHLCEKDKVVLEKPRLLRERTYDVLEPRFVKGPSDQHAREDNTLLSRKAARRPSYTDSHRQGDAMETDQDASLALFRPPLLFGPRRHLSLDVHVRPQPEMIDDVELPNSPPAMDDDDFEGPLFDRTSGATTFCVPNNPSLSDGDLDNCGAHDPSKQNNASEETASSSGTEPSQGHGIQLKSSRSLLSLKEDYKGKLKKFWSKF